MNEFGFQNVLDTRHKFGGDLSRVLKGDNLVVIGNIPHALPQDAQEQLRIHGAPPGAYEGRMPCIAMALGYPGNISVLMQERPFPAETSLYQMLARRSGLNMPNIMFTSPFAYTAEEISQAAGQHLGDSFIYPFIGTNQLGFSEGSTLPDSSGLNNKAIVRLLMRNNGMGDMMPSGGEIFMEKLTSTSSRWYDHLLDEVQNGKTMFAKVANSASGLSTVRLSPQTPPAELTQVLDTMPVSPDGAVVYERAVQFGESGQLADFGVRGSSLPDGTFYPLSIGRVISTEGVYNGMVYCPDDPRRIGLTHRGVSSLFGTLKVFSHEIATPNGYWGPLNLDVFSDPEGKVQLVHDPNMREGGSSASGAFAPILIGPDKVAVDFEARMRTPSALSETEINTLLFSLMCLGIYPYATTFLRHPRRNGDETVYTMKLITEGPEKATTDSRVKNYIGFVSDRLTNRFGFRFELND
jgi:hypothetical protein